MTDQVSGFQSTTLPPLPGAITPPPTLSSQTTSAPNVPPPAPAPAINFQIEKPISQSFEPNPSLNNTSSKKVKILFMLIPFLTMLTAFGASYLIIESRKNEPVNYQTGAVKPKPTVASLPATQSGCVFSLRYDKNGQADETLKQEALTEINKIKARIGGGEKAENIVYEITTSVFKYKANPDENPYLKFIAAQSFNFCFSNIETADNMLGGNFYLQNPSFKENLINNNSKPFEIFDANKVSYALMFISK